MGIRWRSPQVFVRVGLYGVAAILVGVLFSSQFLLSLWGLISAFVFAAAVILVDIVRSEVPGLFGDLTLTMEEERLNRMRFEFGAERDTEKYGPSWIEILVLGAVLLPGLAFIVMASAALARALAGT